jgi:hypothetical protein
VALPSNISTWELSDRALEDVFNKIVMYSCSVHNE